MKRLPDIIYADGMTKLVSPQWGFWQLDKTNKASEQAELEMEKYYHSDVVVGIQKELEEQARLLGKQGSREAALLATVSQLEKESREIKEKLERVKNDLHVLGLLTALDPYIVSADRLTEKLKSINLYINKAIEDLISRNEKGQLDTLEDTPFSGEPPFSQTNNPSTKTVSDFFGNPIKEGDEVVIGILSKATVLGVTETMVTAKQHGTLPTFTFPSENCVVDLRVQEMNDVLKYHSGEEG